jgi:hypothetical protein
MPEITTARVGKTPVASRGSPTRFAWLSIAADLLTIGLLSDAIESFVNLVGGILALAV